MRVHHDPNPSRWLDDGRRERLDIEDALPERDAPPWWVGLVLPVLTIAAVMGFGLVWYAVESLVSR